MTAPHPTDGDTGLVEPTYLTDLCNRSLEWSRSGSITSAGFIVRDLTNSIEALSAEVERLRREFDEREKVYEGVVQSLISARASRLSSIEAETIERCAKIADKHASDSWGHTAEVSAAEAIATAIRNRKG